MANRRAMKLFAVAILGAASSAQAENWSGYVDTTIKPRQLADGRPAAGNTVGKTPPRDEGDDRAEQQSLADALAAFEAEERRAKLVVEPKRIAARPKPITKEARALLAAEREYDAVMAIEIKPRLYANFRPACGNTGGKVERPSDCTGTEVRAAYAYDKEYARLAQKRDQKAEAVYKKILAAADAATRADQAVVARMLGNGRPACGNTMSKAGPPAYCSNGDDQ